MDTVKRREWVEYAGTLALSLLLYKTGVLFFLFLVPLIWLYFRRGEIWYVYSGVILEAAIIFLGMFSMRNLPDGIRTRLVLMEAALSVSFFAGIWFMVHGSHPSRIYRSLKGISVIGVFSIPLVVFFRGSSELVEYFSTQITDIVRISLGEDMLGAYDLHEDNIAVFALDMFLRNFLASIYIMVTTVYYFTRKLFRLYTKVSSGSLREFVIERGYVWIFTGAWTGIIASFFLDLGILEYIFWNTGLIFLYLYGLQGIGIIEFLFDKYSVRRGNRMALAVVGLFGLFLPGTGLLLMLGIPVFGASDTWIRYREKEKRI